jgi:hypothetical protein
MDQRNASHIVALMMDLDFQLQRPISDWASALHKIRKINYILINALA